MLQKLAGETMQVHCNWQRRPELIVILSLSSEVTVLYVATLFCSRSTENWRAAMFGVNMNTDQNNIDESSDCGQMLTWVIFSYKVIMLLCKSNPHRYSRYLKEHNNPQYWLLIQKISLTVTEQFYLFYVFTLLLFLLFSFLFFFFFGRGCYCNLMHM